MLIFCCGIMGQGLLAMEFNPEFDDCGFNLTNLVMPNEKTGKLLRDEDFLSVDIEVFITDPDGSVLHIPINEPDSFYLK